MGAEAGTVARPYRELISASGQAQGPAPTFHLASENHR